MQELPANAQKSKEGPWLRNDCGAQCTQVQQYAAYLAKAKSCVLPRLRVLLSHAEYIELLQCCWDDFTHIIEHTNQCALFLVTWPRVENV
eukprot:5726964-Amphidinium_carterae.1